MHDSSEGAGAPQAEMPRYVSHKTVWALEIASVAHRTDGGGEWELEFVDRGYAGMTAPAEMFARYKPVAGDFYVQYADGYKSFSPRKAFLEGYTRDQPNALELGAAVRRAGLADPGRPVPKHGSGP